MIVAIMTILMAGLVSSAPYTFGAKPDSGFLGSNDCKSDPTKNGAFLQKCCWTTQNGDKYCQFCVFEYTGADGQGKYTDCTDKVKQSLDFPPNPPPSSPSGPAAPIQDDGVLEQTDNPNRDSIMNNLNGNEGVLDSQ